MAESESRKLDMTDPSVLTMQVVWREVAALKELLEARIAAVEKSIIVAHEDLVRIPTETQKAVGGLKELHEVRLSEIEKQFKDQAALRDEKFAGVQKQFEGNKTAVDAALDAVKQVSNKSESAFVKQIDQILLLINTTTQTFEGKITDLKDRFNRNEGRFEGTKETKTTQQDTNKYWIAVAGLLFAVLTFFIGRGRI